VGKRGQKWLMIDDAIAAIAEYDLVDWPITTNYTAWNVIFDYDEYDIGE
jgi:hypothetical protein